MTPKPRALIVDGDAHNLVIASSMLDQMEIEYKRSTNAAKAVEQGLKCQPDFILLNLSLPEADAFLICEALSDQLKGVPVIAMGMDEELLHHWARLQRSDFAACVSRPLIQKELDSVITGLIHGQAD